MQTVQTINPGNIEQTGIASITKTFLYSVAGAFLTILLTTVYHYDFGSYEAAAMIVLPTLFKVIEKVFFAYNITVTDPVSNVPVEANVQAASQEIK